MNFFSWFLYPIVFGFFLAPLVSGVRWLMKYWLMKVHYNERHEVLFNLIPSLTALAFGLILFTGIIISWLQIWRYAIFDFIVSVVSYLMISITSFDKIYVPVGTEIDSGFKAFRKGYTEGISMRILSCMPVKIVVHITYLLILIASQIISLYFSDCPIYTSEFYTFLEVNKYGIVIMYAFEKIFASISKNDEKEKTKILQETYDTMTKEEERLDAETREKFNELKSYCKLLREERKKERQEKKKNKTKK